VAFDGTNYLVAAYDGQDLAWTRVSPSGEVIDRHSLPVGISSDRVSVAFNGTDHLVTWTDWSSGEADIYGARVDTAGVALDPEGFPISTAPGNQTKPDVAANGPFLVVWTDTRSGRPDIYGGRISATGQRLDGDGFAIATGPEPKGTPAVTAGPGDEFGVVTQEFVPTAPYGSHRAFLRTVAPK